MNDWRDESPSDLVVSPPTLQKAYRHFSCIWLCGAERLKEKASIPPSAPAVRVTTSGRLRIEDEKRYFCRVFRSALPDVQDTRAGRPSTLNCRSFGPLSGPSRCDRPKQTNGPCRNAVMKFFRDQINQGDPTLCIKSHDLGTPTGDGPSPNGGSWHYGRRIA